MFPSRFIQRVIARAPQAKKFSAAAPIRDGVFREKGFSETWLGDKGAYPVMSISVLGAFACTAFGIFYLWTSPDARLATGGSRSRMFRADIAQDYVKEDVDVCK